MLRPTLASQYSLSEFAQGVLDTLQLRVQSSLIVSAILNAIGFHEIVERWCGDQGDVPVSKMLEAYIHCRYNSDYPVPVSRFQEWVSSSIVPFLVGIPAEKLDEYRLGRVLDAVGPVAQGMWGEIISRAHRHFRFNVERVINDTTSFYFEGEYEDSGFVTFGYSRDKRPDCKQINVSLTVTELDSIPLLYWHLPGNTADSTTAIPTAEQLCTLLKTVAATSNKLVMIADRGLMTRPIVHYYLKAGIGFMGCILASKDEEKAIASVPDAEVLASPLSYLPSRLKKRTEAKKNAERYYGVRRSVTLSKFKDDKTGVEYPAVTLDGLVVLAEGKRRLDSQKREGQLSKQEARLREILGHLNTGRYKKHGFADDKIKKALSKYPPTRDMLSYELTTSEDGRLSLSWTRKDDVIKKAATLDGKYIVFTSESHLNNHEVLSHYKNRDKVEKRVEVLKGTLKVRPIYLHKDERILGLLFSNMISLLVYGLTEMQARRAGKTITGEQLQKLFADYSASVLVFEDGSQVVTPPRGNKWQRQLHEALHVAPLNVQQVSAEYQLHLPVVSECPWGTSAEGHEHATQDGS